MLGGVKVRELEKKDIEVKEEIAVGKTGKVFKGRWGAQDKTIAVKIVISEEVVIREIELLAPLHHPNIVEFLGIVKAKPTYYILTELAANGSLFQFLHKEKRRPTPEQTERWPMEIAKGMSYVHNLKVTHRDLKSKCVLLTDDWKIKLTGFASAKEHDHTTIQTVGGTCRWMAPEVIRGDPVSMSCDLFSFGMIVLEIHTCELPYADVPEMMVNVRIATGQIPDIPDDCCEPYLVKMLEQCWEEEPPKRPTFEEVLSILEKKGA